MAVSSVQSAFEVWRSKIIQSLMDEELEQPVLSFLNGEEGCDEEYSSISEFKHHLKDDTLADHERFKYGWVFWRENEQQLNNTTHLQHKITTLFKYQSSSCMLFNFLYYMVQFWSVVKVEGRRHYLSTSHQPFYVSHLRKGLCWYRNLSRDHVYRVEEDGPVEEAQLGGVGRAYRNKHPESTPDLRLYSTNEFPLRDHAALCGFRFYLALPLFHLHNNECCGVIELLSHLAGMNGFLISSLYHRLQIAGLRSTHINFIPVSYVTSQMPDKYKQQGDTEIRELLETVIQALPRLSLAQVWVYCKQCVNYCCMERSSFIAAPSKKVNSCDDFNGDLFDYLQACEFHHLQLDRNHFHQNLWDRSISKSPLEHYAQRGRLSHRFAICMQSVDNSNDPFVIEFFLQPECSSLHLLSRIIQMKLKSFTFEWEGELLEIFQSSRPNEIECESIDMLKVMNSYQEKFSESNSKEYMDSIDDSCCLRPPSVDSQEGWVFSCPSRERLSCENHVSSNTVFVPLLMKGRIEEFLKKMAIQSGRRSYWIVQFWTPKLVEGRCYLETYAQPYALGCLAKGLASFRKECMKHHYFVDDEAKEEELGPPGRVFRNKHPEITPDLLLYSTKEFPMKNYAMHCCLQKYFVLPVFDECKHECAGVLEFIGFGCSKLEDIGEALKETKLRSTDHIHFRPRSIADKPATIINCRKNALNEVSDAFSLIHKIPHVHMAKMWVPYEKCDFISSNASCMELALSTNSIGVQGYEYMPTDEVHWIHVQPRKGIIGMALESESKSCFCRDLSEFNIIDQPLALNDRSERLDVCFAICLESSHTGDLTYVLEFFLNPSPQYLKSFFEFLLAIMKQELKGFKYSCGKQLGEELVVDVIQFSEASNLAFSELGQLDDVPIKFRSVQYGQMEHQQAEEAVQYVSDGMQTEQCRAAAASVSKKTEKGKRNTGFHLSLEYLEPHFGKKLKDVAEELGVGRSTIKRACRYHGIKRWPCTEKQTKNPCIYEKEKEQDSHQDEHPSSSGSHQLLDTSLHQNGPCTNTESLIVLEEVEKVMIKGSPKKKAHKAVVKERKVRSFDLLPLPLKMLCSYAENELNDGRSILVALDDEVFGDKCKIYVHLDDIIPFCDLEPISGNCIVVYIWQLYNKIKEENTLRRFQFVNPFTISYVPNGKSNTRAYALADRLNVASPDQLVLVPCNISNQWILTVIEPYKNIVSMLNPFNHCIYDQTWEHIVNLAMNLFSANLMKYDTRKPIWEVIKVPRQPDFKQCGYYVMRFMKEIVEGLNTIDSGSLSSLFVNKDKEYSQTDIDEVRIEWTNCLMSVQYGQMEHQQAEEPVQYVSDGMQTEQCRAAAASVSKKTEKGKRKFGFNPSIEDLKPHYGKSMNEVAELFDVSRSTFKRGLRSLGIDKWPNTKKQSRNLCRNSEKEKELDSQQEVQPSSIGNLGLLDASLHQNGPCTNTERLIVEEEVEKVIMKVRFGQDMIKFELLLSLGVGKLLEEVATKLSLKMGTFKLKYLDEDNDEILVTGDADLQLCPKTRTATSRNCIELFVQLVS